MDKFENRNVYQESSIDIGMGILASWSDLEWLEDVVGRIKFGKNNLQQDLSVHGNLQKSVTKIKWVFGCIFYYSGLKYFRIVIIWTTFLNNNIVNTNNNMNNKINPPWANQRADETLWWLHPWHWRWWQRHQLPPREQRHPRESHCGRASASSCQLVCPCDAHWCWQPSIIKTI